MYSTAPSWPGYFFCVQNQMPRKNLHTIVLSQDFFFYIYSFDNSINRQNLWWCGSIYLKTVLNFFKIFLDFRLDNLKKQIIINLSNKSHAFVVLSDSKVAFLGEGEEAAFYPFLYCVLFIQGRIIEAVCCQIFLSSILQEVFHQGLQLYCF